MASRWLQMFPRAKASSRQAYTAYHQTSLAPPFRGQMRNGAIESTNRVAEDQGDAPCLSHRRAVPKSVFGLEQEEILPFENWFGRAYAESQALLQAHVVGNRR